jgi:hypothetical protein
MSCVANSEVDTGTAKTGRRALHIKIQVEQNPVTSFIHVTTLWRSAYLKRAGKQRLRLAACT